MKQRSVATKKEVKKPPVDAQTIGSRFGMPVADTLLQGLQGGSPLFAPTWLLPRPMRLHTQQGQPFYQGPLQIHAGPHRVEAAWWDSSQPPHQRDYSVALSAHMGPLLICSKSAQRNATSADDAPAAQGVQGVWYAVAVYG